MAARAIRYAWKGNAPDGDFSSAQYVGERLAAIERAKGKLRPVDALQDARSTNSPLHRYFEWDDNEAGEKYRLVQARQLIASVYVQAIDKSPIKSPIRAFVNIRDPKTDQRQYESIHVVLSDKSKRARLLDRAAGELKEWEQRYQHLEEFAIVFDAIERLESV